MTGIRLKLIRLTCFGLNHSLRASMDFKNDSSDHETTRYSSNFTLYCFLADAGSYIIASTVVCRFLTRVRYEDDLHILGEFYLYYKVSLVYFIVTLLYFASRFASENMLSISEQFSGIWSVVTMLYMWQSVMIFYVILLSVCISLLIP